MVNNKSYFLAAVPAVASLIENVVDEDSKNKYTEEHCLLQKLAYLRFDAASPGCGIPEVYHYFDKAAAVIFRSDYRSISQLMQHLIRPR